MFHLAKTTAALCLALTLAGCGSSEGASNSGQTAPDSVAFADESTTTAAARELDEEPPTISVTTISVPEIEITPEMIVGMLETEQGRAMMAQGLAGQTGISIEESECLIGALGPDELADAAASFMTGSGEGFTPEQHAELGAAAESCGVPIETLLGS